MWALFKSALAGSWLKVVQWGGVAAALLATFYTIRKGGKDAERAEQAQRSLQNAAEADEARRDSMRLPTSAVRERLRSKWQRD